MHKVQKTHYLPEPFDILASGVSSVAYSVRDRAAWFAVINYQRQSFYRVFR